MSDKISNVVTRCYKALQQLSLPGLIGCAIWLLTASAHVHANPSGGNVIAGGASISHHNAQTIINQTTDKAIIEWVYFNIGAGEATIFQQPGINSITLNRILSNDPSYIYGSLMANGRIILINPAGIVFGLGSQIDVGGLVATTSNISNQDFLANKFQFSHPLDRPKTGMIINSGQITARDGGLVALIAPAVENNGIIQANLGKVILASGTDYTLDFYGDGLINFKADSKILDNIYDPNGNVIKNAVNNRGRISANGGKVLLTANTAKEAVDQAINNEGLIEAQTAANINGEILLLAGSEGDLHLSGKLDVSGEHGGKIKASGKNIKLTSATLNADGEKGGGEILIGGDYQGQGNFPRAQTVTVDKNSYLSASARTQGNGGRIIIWSDYLTNYTGNLSAKGGAQSGNGGFAEVSGKQWLNFSGKVNLDAPYGAKGTLLLDPYDIYIQATGPTSGSFDGAQYTSQTGSSILLVSDLENALAFSNVVIQTGSNGTQLGNITVVDPLTWTNSNKLTLKAHNDININAQITNSGGGSLVLRADSDADGTGTVTFSSGSVLFTNGGTVDIYYNPTNTSPHKYRNPINYAPYVSFSSGGTLTAAMLVNNLTDLDDIKQNRSGTYTLGSDIDAAPTVNWNDGLGFRPIGNIELPFTGTLIGNGYAIKNLYINRPGNFYTGLFGYTSGSTIKSLNLANARVIGGENVGALVGYNSGTLRDITVSGYVEGDENVGGLAGSNGGNIQQTLSTATIVGYGSYTGGLVGFMYGGSDNNNYWDMGTSGQLASAMGTGKTTAQLMQAGTYSGWDFTNTWGIINNSSYPYFQARYPTAPQVVSGYTYQNDGTTALGANKTINLYASGGSIASSLTGANGFYYTIFDRDLLAYATPLLAFIENDTVRGNTLTLTANQPLTNLNIHGNTIRVRSYDGTALANSDFASATGYTPNPNFLFDLNSYDLTLDDHVSFNTYSGTPYRLDGDITAYYNSINFNGPVSLTNYSPALTTYSSDINFYNTLNGYRNLHLTANNGNIYFGADVGGQILLRDLYIYNANNVTADQYVFADNFVQYSGTGNTLFNLDYGLYTNNLVSINTNYIEGLFNAYNTQLYGYSGIAAGVTTAYLTLGTHGLATVYGTISGFSDNTANKLVTLDPDYTGAYFINGCPSGKICNGFDYLNYLINNYSDPFSTVLLDDSSLAVDGLVNDMSTDAPNANSFIQIKREDENKEKLSNKKLSVCKA